MKKHIIIVMQASYSSIGAIVLVAVLTIGLLAKRPAHAASDRAKKVAGIFIGGGTGGGIAAIAGSAKWFPLGFGIGGLAGGLIARKIIKNRRARRAQHAPYAAQQTRRSRRAFYDENQFTQQPAAAYRRHIRNSEY